MQYLHLLYQYKVHPVLSLGKSEALKNFLIKMPEAAFHDLNDLSQRMSLHMANRKHRLWKDNKFLNEGSACDM